MLLLIVIGISAHVCLLFFARKSKALPLGKIVERLTHVGKEIENLETK